MDEDVLKLAQKRIWKRLEKKLPDRGISSYQPVLRSMRHALTPEPVSRLKQVQLKERLMEVLPESQDLGFWPRLSALQFWSVPVLGVLLSTFLFAGVRFAPPALAASDSVIKPVEGIVLLNGQRLTEDTLIRPGDRLSTGEGSLAHVTFLDDSRLTLGPSTEVDVLRLDTDVDNVIATQVELRQTSGQVWVQVLNLVSEDAFLTLQIGDVTAKVTQSASFDARFTDAGAELRVASHWLDVSSQDEQWDYQTVLAQEEAVRIGAGIQKRILTETEQDEVWWVFNEAYGQSYARLLDASYEKAHIARATILPGSPFYPLKTFREKVQLTLAWGETAKQDLLVEQAQTRLSEAKVLLASGQEQEAKEALDAYEATVEEVLASNGSAQVEALVDQAQKEAVAAVLAKTEVQATDALIEDSLHSTVQVLAEVKEDSSLLSVQPLPNLSLTPDFLEQQRFEDAAAALASYQDQMDHFSQYFANLSAEEQARVAAEVLDQNLAELQDLRVLISTEVDMDDLSDEEKKSLLQLQNLATNLRDQKLTTISQLTLASSALSSAPLPVSSADEGVAAASGMDEGEVLAGDEGAGVSGEDSTQGSDEGQALPEIRDPRFD